MCCSPWGCSELDTEQLNNGQGCQEGLGPCNSLEITFLEEKDLYLGSGCLSCFWTYMCLTLILAAGVDHAHFTDGEGPGQQMLRNKSKMVGGKGPPSDIDSEAHPEIHHGLPPSEMRRRAPDMHFLPLGTPPALTKCLETGGSSSAWPLHVGVGRGLQHRPLKSLWQNPQTSEATGGQAGRQE